MVEMQIVLCLDEEMELQLTDLARRTLGQNTETAKRTALEMVATDGLRAKLAWFREKAQAQQEALDALQVQSKKALRATARREQRACERRGVAKSDFEPMPTPEQDWEGC